MSVRLPPKPTAVPMAGSVSCSMSLPSRVVQLDHALRVGEIVGDQRVVDHAHAVEMVLCSRE